jgi:hypothetical protein
VNQKLRAVVTSAIILLGVSTLAGCGVNADGGSPSTGVQSAEPAQSEAPEAEEPVLDLGDVAVMTDAGGEPVVITDEFGDYQKVTITADALVLSLDETKLDESVAASGWSNEDVLSAQRWLMTFIAEEGIDSVAIDGTTGWDEWKKTKGPVYVAPEWVAFLENKSEGFDRSTFILNNANNEYPVTIRDGSPRIAASSISVDAVEAIDVNSESNLVFTGTSTTDYRVSDAANIARYQVLNPGASEADVLSHQPELADGIDGIANVSTNYKYSMRKDAMSGWFITGYDLSTK